MSLPGKRGDGGHTLPDRVEERMGAKVVLQVAPAVHNLELEGQAHLVGHLQDLVHLHHQGKAMTAAHQAVLPRWREGGP
jgi:hypothetical protein